MDETSGITYVFRQKVTAAVAEGYTFLEYQSYDAFNEGTQLIGNVERYRERYGYYPEAVLADKIHRSRGNQAYYRERGIRLSGPPLGRPKKKPDREEKRQRGRDNNERNMIDGRFGIAKRRFGLGLIMAYFRRPG